MGDVTITVSSPGSASVEAPDVTNRYDLAVGNPGEAPSIETDPTVPDHVKAITEEQIENWDGYQQQIDAEVEIRDNDVSTLAGNITAEATVRAAGDTTLQSAIDDETTNREDGDIALSNSINSEVTSRTNSDNNLQSQIDGKAALSHSHDASHITSGVFDVARIPIVVTVGPAVIPAGGTVASLTIGEQANVRLGIIVVTSDGRRWYYTGIGSKTLEASYIELADTTPEWSVIANKPSTFTPSAHTHLHSEITNFFSGVLASVLTGLNTGLSGSITSSDSILSAIGKTVKLLNDLGGNLGSLADYISDEVINREIADINLQDQIDDINGNFEYNVQHTVLDEFVDIDDGGVIPSDTLIEAIGKLNAWLGIMGSDLGIAQSTISDHIANSSNPHNVTKSQVGLGSADDTSDANKPVSTPQQNALNLKLNIADEYSNANAYLSYI